MRERPILFSGPMVQALLAGRKTQTRRVVKPQPPNWIDKYEPAIGEGWWIPSGVFISDPSGMLGRGALNIRRNETSIRCPYGVPGDRLWCKHTYWYKPASDLTPEIAWSPELPRAIHRDHRGTWQSDIPSTLSEIERHGGFRKRPSIHMPRWASRIPLEVVSVRVERVQEIGKDGRKARDVLAEGITQEQIEHYHKFFHVDDSPALAYAALWEEINGKGSWAANPFVWVVEFKRAERAA